MDLHFLRKFLPLTSLIIFNLFGCYNPNKSYYSQFCKSVENICLNGKSRVEMITTKGTILIEVNSDLAPVTSSNFLDLVDKGFYIGTTFNRVIKKPFPYIIQGGYKSNNFIFDRQNNFGNKLINNKNRIFRTIPLEIKLINEKYPRYNQPVLKNDDFINIQLTHKRGVLAMARTKLLESSSIQFYIALKDLPELDGRYSVFGKVLKGMAVIDSLEEGDEILDVIQINK
ncbi:peptidylprolyl isomerase [Prochlorococcus marinus]|uniref:peptidylprolyl isomerase n=1 Tax=Prochlorococcus marinus TaxID=1219 RepID=UPI0022B53E29|nr:peptidylprolyl isomerase [Prochlorococcus marinus]